MDTFFAFLGSILSMQSRYHIIYIILFLFVGHNSYTQDNGYDQWNTLAMVNMQSKFDDMMGMIIKTATPTPIVQALEGKEIEIRGYMIALDVKAEQSHFMFSRYPQNMCFFCGAAGPESAMQVFMKEKKKIKHTTNKVVLKGTLNIQQGDPTGLIYTLTNADLLEILD